jgi:hypothetical protein
MRKAALRPWRLPRSLENDTAGRIVVLGKGEGVGRPKPSHNLDQSPRDLMNRTRYPRVISPYANVSMKKLHEKWRFGPQTTGDDQRSFRIFSSADLLTGPNRRIFSKYFFPEVPSFSDLRLKIGPSSGPVILP